MGAAIEEIDILDLQERLAQTDNADIQQVFNNLLNGSYNHLRAFVSTLEDPDRRNLPAAVPERRGLPGHYRGRYQFRWERRKRWQGERPSWAAAVD